eukprot:9469213-Pyramimonas_sp.AAC.1
MTSSLLNYSRRLRLQISHLQVVLKVTGAAETATHPGRLGEVGRTQVLLRLLQRAPRLPSPPRPRRVVQVGQSLRQALLTTAVGTRTAATSHSSSLTRTRPA